MADRAGIPGWVCLAAAGTVDPSVVLGAQVLTSGLFLLAAAKRAIERDLPEAVAVAVIASLYGPLASDQQSTRAAKRSAASRPIPGWTC